MCGRYAIGTNVDELIELFELIHAAPTRANWNVTPQSVAPVVLTSAKRGGRTLEPLQWGFLPSTNERSGAARTAEDLSPPKRHINARLETVDTRPTFRTQLHTRRCIVPASGFYEWQKAGAGVEPARRRARTPYFIQQRERRPLALAGLWNRTRNEDGTLHHSFLILTRAMPAPLAHIHDRAPVALSGEALRRWLAPKTAAHEALSLIRRDVAPDWVAHRVGDAVNRGSAEGPALAAPIASET